MSTTYEVADAQLGHRLAQLRERRGMKQAELARKITWSQAVLSRIEAGERTISHDELTTLLEAIGTNEAADLAVILDRDWQYLPRPPLDHPDQHLLWRAEEMVVALEAAGSVPGTPAAFRTRLDEYIKELRRLAGLILRTEHQIAFTGHIGVGKSTAICRATNLETTGPHGRTAPVLEVGGGGVTLCEVHLGHGPGYGIIVEPRSHDDIRADVEDFVDQLVHTQPTTPDDDGTPAVPREIDRAIRNMAELVKKRATKDADSKIPRTDPAQELAKKFPARRDLVVEVLTRMGLHRRDRRDEWHNATLALPPLEWMKTTFEQINNGRHPEFSLPARIDLVVPELLEIDDLDVSVIDTRGIDQPSARADLEALLEDPHTVSILCSAFNDAPSGSVQHLLKRAREIHNTVIDSNVGILVLARPGEALAVKDETGSQAETTAEGYELKDEQLRNSLVTYRLSDSPTLFFNALEDDPDGLRAFLRERVIQTRAGFQQQLDDVLARMEFLLANAEHEQVQEVQREATRHLAAWIKQHRAPAPIGEHVHDTLLDEIARVHAASVNAAVRREGEWRSLSYTHQLGYGARKIAVAALKESVTGFTALCQTLSESMPQAKELLTQAEQLMKTAYDELLRKVQLASLTLYRAQLRQDPQFWLDNAAEWGTGTGYVKRVLGHNRKWFEAAQRRELENHLAGVLDREWRAVLGRVEAIFEQA